MKRLLLLGLFLIGCSERPSYDLSISSKFTPRHIELIIDAVEQWEYYCGIRFQIRVEEISDLSIGVIYPAKTNIFLGPFSDDRGTHYAFVNKIPIYIEHISTDDWFFRTVQHELGHFIGGLHTNNVGDVMYHDGAGLQITYSDLESVCPWR